MKKQLDTTLGRVTMYRLVLLVLATLAAYSVLLDLLGWLTFGVPAMLVTLAVTIGITYGVTWLFALAFRTRPHTESSLITGLLLYFLFWPTLATPDLAGIALAAAVAAASKFLLAIRGRHIFNPAATGALVIGLTGLNVATWWAATPAMLPAVVVGIALVLYRTGKLWFAVIFLAVSTAIISTQLLAAGSAAAGALLQPLVSRPGLFFVGFMLTEPLALPPRRWQQLSMAAVVGVLFAVPFDIGPLYHSPELALLIGNALAFLAGQRRGLALTFTGARELTPTSREYRFSLAAPARFRAGQYMELTVPPRSLGRRADSRGTRRVFSLTSDPREAGRLDGGHVTFGLRLPEPPATASTFKGSLNALRPGERIRATRIGGDFVLPPGPEPLLLLAGGVGITAFMSQLRDLARVEPDRNVVLIYAASTPAELGYRQELTVMATSMPNLRLLVLASEDAGIGEYLGSGYPSADQLAAAAPDLAGRRIYVSGSPSFVAHAKASAKAAGGRRVRTDTFLGY